MSFAIVVARFYEHLADRLVGGAQTAFAEAGAGEADVFDVPGAFELPLAARFAAQSGRYDGVACLGAVIRGATPHFDLVVREAASGVGALTAEGKLAVAFGVLACENIEQAVERAGAKAGNRGADAAMVAVEMADLYAHMAAEKAAEPTVSVVPPPVSTTTDLPRRK